MVSGENASMPLLTLGSARSLISPASVGFRRAEIGLPEDCRE